MVRIGRQNNVYSQEYSFASCAHENSPWFSNTGSSKHAHWLQTERFNETATKKLSISCWYSHKFSLPQSLQQSVKQVQRPQLSLELRKNITDIHVKGKDYKTISKQLHVPLTTADINQIKPFNKAISSTDTKGTLKQRSMVLCTHPHTKQIMSTNVSL